MEVIKISPRGYCYGVIDAMVIARNASYDKSLPRPIYILGMIVHNQHVADAFLAEDIITLDGESRIELIKKIDFGTVIFTAHGISPQVREIALKKNLTVIDATCPDVVVTHEIIAKKQKEDYYFIYIGKKNHPEPEAAIGYAPNSVYLVENCTDVDNLQINSDKIIITNQTTMSKWDVCHLIEYILNKYPHAIQMPETCVATQVRQEAVAIQAREVDLLIVVGDVRSNNTNRLAQVSEEIAKTKAYRIANLSEINLAWLKDVKKVGVTSGASTPTPITKEVISFLQKYDPKDRTTWNTVSQVSLEKILPTVNPKKSINQI